MARLQNALFHVLIAAMILLLTSFMFASGFIAYAYQYEIPAFTYHHILQDSENKHYRNEMVITPEVFREQIRYLYEQGYKTVTLEEMDGFLRGKTKLTGKRALITFDDGYLSNYWYAYDILKEYGYTAVVFIITNRINSEPEEFNPDKTVVFSIPEMAAASDVFEFASHSHNMHARNDDGVSLLLCCKNGEVSADIEKSLSFPEMKKYFAYPYGDFNYGTIKTLKSLGVRLGFTIKSGYVTKGTNPYMIPRFTVKGSTTFDEFKSIIDNATN